MTEIEIIAVGRMKNTPYAQACRDYLKQIPWIVTLHELDVRQDQEHKKIIEKIRDDAYVFALDERGKSLSSRDFAGRLQNLIDQGPPCVQFIIGGADGLNEAIRNRADFLLSFGIQTWPHMLVRVMLIEQIYRARQINAGHPYHRD